MNKSHASTIWLGVFLVVAIGAYAYVYRPAPEGLAWKQDFATAQAAATERGAPMLVEFVMEGCTYCRKMELEVFPDKEVQKAASGFVPVKVHLETEPEIVDRYGVELFPTFLVLDHQGNPLTKASGGLSRDHFMTFLRQSSEVVSKVGLAGAAPRSDAS